MTCFSEFREVCWQTDQTQVGSCGNCTVCSWSVGTGGPLASEGRWGSLAGLGPLSPGGCVRVGRDTGHPGGAGELLGLGKPQPLESGVRIGNKVNVLYFKYLFIYLASTPSLALHFMHSVIALRGTAPGTMLARAGTRSATS